MADHIHLEFQNEQDPPFILEKLAEMTRENVDAPVKIRRGRHLIDDLSLVTADVLLKNCEENILFIAEMVVESAAGLARLGGDVFNSRGLEAVAGKDYASSLNQLAPRDERSLLPVQRRFQHLQFIPDARNFI